MLRIKISFLMGILVTVVYLGGAIGIGGMWGLQPGLAHAAEEYEHIRVGLPRVLAGIDPLGYPRLDRPELNVQMCFFDHLFRRADDGRIVGHLATDYKWLNDNTMRIHLRKGVKFHNGDEFTAADVKWSIEDMLNPDRGPGLAGYMKGIEKIVVVDDHTLDLHTDAAIPTLPAKLTCYSPMVSGKERSKVPPEVYEKKPMGTGPFKFIEWKKGEYVKMVRNENYFKGVPKIKRLTFYPITDQNTRVSALRAGSIDIAMDISPSIAAALKGTSGIEITSKPSARCELVWFNTEKPPFNDRRLRQAANYAVNKEELVATVIEGYGLPTGQTCPSYFFGHNPEVKPYPYDTEKAKQLLAEAGYPNGLDVIYANPTTQEETARAVAGYLNAVGIRCKMEVKELGANYADMLERRMRPIHHMSWGNWSLLDIDGTLQYVFGCTKPGQGRWSYYCNPRIEEIITELRTVDEEKRLRLAREANTILHDDAAALFLYFRKDIHAKRTGIPEFKARVDNTVRFKWVKGEK